MSEEIKEPVVAEPVIEQSAPEAVVAPEPPKEFIFRYQPKDENGSPLGGEQVIKAANPEEALQKMAAQNSELVKLNRRLNRDIRIGNVTKDELPESAQRFDPNKYDLSPVPMTADELVEVSRDIQDPENFGKAAARIVKSQIGDPEALRARLIRLEEDNARLKVKEEAESFVRSEPDYYPCSDNLAAIGNWMLKNNLDPIKENFKLAYDTLADVLVKRPVVEVPKVVEPTPTPEVVAVQPTPAPAPRPVSSGLTRAQASDAGTPQKTGYTTAEIDKMSAEEYKAKILMPEFKKQRQQATR
jgi:hypothetical protein